MPDRLPEKYRNDYSRIPVMSSKIAPGVRKSEFEPRTSFDPAWKAQKILPIISNTEKEELKQPMSEGRGQWIKDLRYMLSVWEQHQKRNLTTT